MRDGWGGAQPDYLDLFNSRAPTMQVTDRNGKTYELQFESDGSPMIMRRVRQYSLAAKKPRARQSEQIECRYRAAVARVLPRDQTDYILQCLAQLGEKSPASAHP